MFRVFPFWRDLLLFYPKKTAVMENDYGQILKYLRGEATLEERLRIMEWAKSDDANRKELQAFRRIYEALLLSDEEVAAAPAGSGKWHRIIGWIGSAAAAAAVAVGVWFFRPDDGGQAEDLAIASLSAPFGHQTETVLNDGTKVRLNSGSRLEIVDCGKTERRVRLEGEAYFDVAHDEDRPFVLQTPQGMEVRVLGTVFNVTAYDDVQSVVLVDGVVEAGGADSEEDVRLEPSQRFVYDTKSGTGTVEDIDPEEYTSWTKGYIMLRQASVSDIFHRLGLYYGVTILWDEKDFEGITVNGKLVLDEGLGTALSTISMMVPVEIRQISGTEVSVTAK